MVQKSPFFNDNLYPNKAVKLNASKPYYSRDPNKRTGAFLLQPLPAFHGAFFRSQTRILEKWTPSAIVRLSAVKAIAFAHREFR